MSTLEVIRAMRHWLKSVVIDLNLCPFAGRELLANRVRFEVTDATTEEQLLLALELELELLDDDISIETTLLIHPKVLEDFQDYNQFLNNADALLVEKKLEGIYQIASFHPDYQFTGTESGDVENYTNRSPYPLLHILREDSLEQAIAGYPDIDDIPTRNIELMNSLGRTKLEILMKACFKVAGQLDAREK